jgi:hypothetical protein
MPRSSTTGRLPTECIRASTTRWSLSVGVTHGAQRPRCERRDVHARHRFWIPEVVFITASYGLGDGGARRREPGRVLSLQGRSPRRPTPVLRRNLVRRPSRWSMRRLARLTAFKRSTCYARSASALDQRRGRYRLRGRHSSLSSTTVARWTSNGARMARPGSCTFCRHGLKPCRAARAAASQRFTLQEPRLALAQGRSIGQRIGAGHARIVASVKDIERATRRRAGR